MTLTFVLQWMALITMACVIVASVSLIAKMFRATLKHRRDYYNDLYNSSTMPVWKVTKTTTYQPRDPQASQEQPHV